VSIHVLTGDWWHTESQQKIISAAQQRELLLIHGQTLSASLALRIHQMGSPLWHCNEVHLELARPALPLPLFLSGFKKKAPGNQAVLWGPKDAGVWVGQPFCCVICSCSVWGNSATTGVLSGSWVI